MWPLGISYIRWRAESSYKYNVFIQDVEKDAPKYTHRAGIGHWLNCLVGGSVVKGEFL